MWTTVTLDDDVAARTKRLELKSHRLFKELINAALRAGLERIDAAPAAPAAVRLPALDLDACLVGSLDDVAEVLELAEGPRGLNSSWTNGVARFADQFARAR